MSCSLSFSRAALSPRRSARTGAVSVTCVSIYYLVFYRSRGKTWQFAFFPFRLAAACVFRFSLFARAGCAAGSFSCFALVHATLLIRVPLQRPKSRQAKALKTTCELSKVGVFDRRSSFFRSAVVLFSSTSSSSSARKKFPASLILPSFPQPKKNSASAESELKARQASARAWVTPWLEARKEGGSGSAAAAAAEPKKPNRPAAAASASASAPSKPAAAKPAAGGKVKGGEVMADGSVMYRF